LLLAAQGPVWIGVGSLDSDLDAATIERIDASAAEALGLRQRQEEDLSAWRARQEQIDQSFRQGNLEASRSASIRLIADLGSADHAWLGSIDLLATSLLMLGQIELERGDELSAAAAFQSHYALRPGATPNPALYRPVVLRAYERLGMAILAGARRRLQVVARPVGSTIWLDGKPRGQAPMSLTGLSPGRHYLRVVAGSRSIQQAVDLGREGRVVTLDLGAGAQSADAFFAAWRRRAGIDPLVAVTSAQGLGRDRFAVGVVDAAEGLHLYGVRLAADGSLSALVVTELKDAKDLGPVADLVRSLRDGAATRPTEAGIIRAFGQPASRLRPLIIGAAASGVAVAVASAIGVYLWANDRSGIVIDPSGLR